MGSWDKIRDRVKGIRNDLSTRVPDAVTKMDQVIRVDAVQKLQQHWPDDETRAQIGLFTYTFVKNTARYAVYEGFKHIPGATVASKLVSDTMREVKQEKQKDGMKAMQAMEDRLEKDLRLSTSQPENFCQKGNLSFQGGGGGGGGAGAGAGVGSEEAKDMINMFMKTEFVGNHMFRNLMVPKTARMEKKDE